MHTVKIHSFLVDTSIKNPAIKKCNTRLTKTLQGQDSFDSQDLDIIDCLKNVIIEWNINEWVCVNEKQKNI